MQGRRESGAGGGATPQFCGADIFPIKKLLQFSAVINVINVQAIFRSTRWRCSERKGVLKNSCSEIKK